MSSFRRLLSGVIMAVLSSGLLLGSILLSYAENGYALALPVPGTQTVTAISLLAVASAMSNFETTTPGFRPTDTPTFFPDPECPPPEGFKIYTVQAGDTISRLAKAYSTSEEAIKKASCIDTEGLSSMSLAVGSVLNVPAVRPVVAKDNCDQPPKGWIYYSVRSGENLISLSLRTNTSLADLQKANCMGNSIDIRIGRLLYLPSYPYSTPVYTVGFPPTVTPSATASRTPILPPSTTFDAPATNTGNMSSATPSTNSEATATINPNPTASETSALQPPTNTPISPDTETPVLPPVDPTDPPPSSTPLPPPSNTPVPPLMDTPVDLPRENTPEQPEPTMAGGFFLHALLLTILMV